MNSAVITPCSHFFHAGCLKKWLYVQETCPLCHSQLKSQSPTTAAPNQDTPASNQSPAGQDEAAAVKNQDDGTPNAGKGEGDTGKGEEDVGTVLSTGESSPGVSSDPQYLKTSSSSSSSPSPVDNKSRSDPPSLPSSFSSDSLNMNHTLSNLHHLSSTAKLPTAVPDPMPQPNPGFPLDSQKLFSDMKSDKFTPTSEELCPPQSL